MGTSRQPKKSERLCRLVDSIWTHKYYIDSSTNVYRLVKSCMSTRRLDSIHSSTRLYRLVESILSTPLSRLDYIDSLNRFYGLVDSIISTHRLDCIDLLTRRLDCIESSTRLY